MAFGRRRMSPIRSIKHVVDASGGITSTKANIPFVIAVDVPNVSSTPTEVAIGSTINAFYISYYTIGSTGAPLSGPIDWYVVKRRDGQSTGFFPDPGNTGSSGVRNQIIHEEKGLPGSGDGTPMVFKGVIKIPPIYRRNRQGDVWDLVQIASATDTPNFCVKFIYKEFR